MTDNRGEVKEPQRGCGSGRRGGAVLQRYTKTPPASTSSPLFLCLHSSLLLPSPRPLRSHEWFVFTSTEVLCMLRLGLWRRAAQHLRGRKWSSYTTWKCLHPLMVAYLCQCCSIRAGRVKTKAAWDTFPSHNMTWKRATRISFKRYNLWLMIVVSQELSKTEWLTNWSQLMSQLSRGGNRQCLHPTLSLNTGSSSSGCQLKFDREKIVPPHETAHSNICGLSQVPVSWFLERDTGVVFFFFFF